MARRSIDVEHLSHGTNPIPAACRVGNVIMTGGIGGSDPASGVVPDDARMQVAHVFANLRRVLENGDHVGRQVKVRLCATLVALASATMATCSSRRSPTCTSAVKATSSTI
jgi:enamine deaminase RidA (YjgF/YER057c/UK114 family)